MFFFFWEERLPVVQQWPDPRALSRCSSSSSRPAPTVALLMLLLAHVRCVHILPLAKLSKFDVTILAFCRWWVEVLELVFSAWQLTLLIPTCESQSHSQTFETQGRRCFDWYTDGREFKDNCAQGWHHAWRFLCPPGMQSLCQKLLLHLHSCSSVDNCYLPKTLTLNDNGRLRKFWFNWTC